MKDIQLRFECLKNQIQGLDFEGHPANIEALISKIFPNDDSAFKWSKSSSGVTRSHKDLIDLLYNKYVAKFDVKSKSSGKTDDDVWRSFKRDLERNNLLNFFDSKVISSEGDEVEFPLAWKNGVWHCIETVSFDLSASDSIRDKAHKFLGQITSIKDAREDFKIYFVVAEPTNDSLDSAFLRAKSILEKIPKHVEIYTEDQASFLVDKFKMQISRHLAE